MDFSTNYSVYHIHFQQQHLVEIYIYYILTVRKFKKINFHLNVAIPGEFIPGVVKLLDFEGDFLSENIAEEGYGLFFY